MAVAASRPRLGVHPLAAFPPGLFWLALGLFAALAILSLLLRGPQIQVDESSYLLTAAALVGKLKTHGVFGYYSGYSLLLAPALWFGSTPSGAYHGALLINAALIATTPFALYRLTSRLNPQIDPRWHMAAAIVATCHTSVLLLSQHTMSENALIPLYAWLAAAAATALLDKSMFAAICCGGLAGMLFLVHPRGGAIAAPVILLLVVPALADARWRKQLLVLCVAMIAIAALHGPLEHLAAKRSSLGSAYAADSVFGRLSEPATWLWMSLNLLGSATEAIVASIGVVVIGVIAIAVDLWSQRKHFGATLARSTILVALVAGLAAGFLMSAIFFVPPQRPDHVAYGRYALPAALPIIAIGLLQFSLPVARRVCGVVLAAAIGIIGIALMAYAFTRLPITITSGWNYINAPALYLAQHYLSFDKAWFAIGAWFLATISILGAASWYSGRAALAVVVVANVCLAALGWQTQEWRMSRVYSENRRVVEAASAFETVTGAPLCVTLSPRVIGWHGVDLRWRLFDHMADFIGQRGSQRCVRGTIDYLADAPANETADSVIATERPPPAMNEAIGLFVAPGPARDAWKAANPPLYMDSFFALPESERRAPIAMRAPATPAHLRVGDSLDVTVRLTNASEHTAWPTIQDGPYPITLGARSYRNDIEGTYGEFRAPLTTLVEPGASVDAEIRVGPFRDAGAYRVDLGMLQEHIGWFVDRAQLDVSVDAR